MSQSLLIALRILHIAAGAIWFGALIIFTFYVMPAISATGPAGRQVMGQLGTRKYPQFVMAMMGVTVLTGLGMMWYFSSSVGGEYFRSPMGRTISMGAAVAILTAVFGVVVPRPTAMKLVALGEAIQKGGGTPTPDQAAEMTKLQARMIMSTRIVVVGLAIAVAAMAGARYL